MRQSQFSNYRVVIVGGGFAGLRAAKAFAQNGFSVTVIDKRNFHLFQPLLYQVATGYLSAADIATPIRTTLKAHKNVRVIQAEVIDIIPENKTVILSDQELTYDFLIIATGLTHNYFRREEWRQYAIGLKTIEEAEYIRSLLLGAFEKAEISNGIRSDSSEPLVFAVIGGGATGVELSGALSELCKKTLKLEFRNLDITSTKILLVEGGSRLLSNFHDESSLYAKKTLENIGVEVLLNTFVRDIQANAITVEQGGQTRVLKVNAVIWAAGVKPTFIAEVLRDRASASLSKDGRVRVRSDLSLETHTEIFILGDLAYVEDQAGQPLPGLAPVAIQQGAYVVQPVMERLLDQPVSLFRYRDRGIMAVIGRGRAVAETGALKLKGVVAWYVWAIIHIYFLIGFESKLIVFFRWSWNYVTHSRSSRLIYECDDDSDEKGLKA